MVKVGDTLPSVPVQEGAPDKTIDLSQELKDGVLVGVPAAFSPTCSQGHIPKYVTKAKSSSAGPVYVVAVNDVFVMNAWHENLDPSKSSGVRFVADPAGEFVSKLDLIFDATGLLGNKRAQRFAIVMKDGKVEKVEVEPDPTKVTVTSADKIL